MFPKIDWIIISHVFTALVVIGGIYGFDRAIKSKIKEEIQSSENIKKLTTLIRPSVVFTSKEVILSDQGGMNYIKSINIEFKENELEPSKIIIDFYNFMQNQPILTSLDAFQYFQKAERGKHYLWEFKIDSIMSTADAETNNYYTFRIEILN